MEDFEEIIEKITNGRSYELTMEDIDKILEALKGNIKIRERFQTRKNNKAGYIDILKDNMTSYLSKLAEYFGCREDEIYIGDLIELELSKSSKQYKVVIGDVILENFPKTEFEYQYIIGALEIKNSNQVDMSKLIEAKRIDLENSRNVKLNSLERVGTIHVTDTKVEFGDIKNVGKFCVSGSSQFVKFNSVGHADSIMILRLGKIEFPLIESVDHIDILYAEKVTFSQIESVSRIGVGHAIEVSFPEINNIREFEADRSYKIDLNFSHIEKSFKIIDSNVKVNGVLFDSSKDLTLSELEDIIKEKNLGQAATSESPNGTITGNDIGNATADVPTQTSDKAAEVVNGLLENTKNAPTV